MKKFRNDLSEYTESEFIGLILGNRGASEEDKDAFIDWLDDTLHHPEGYGIVTHPKEAGIEDTPEAMVAEIKRYYVEQGLPCFKE